MTKEPGKSRRGFASLPEERRREISSMGGKASQSRGAGHRFTSEEARAAGRKGAKAKHDKEREEPR